MARAERLARTLQAGLVAGFAVLALGYAAVVPVFAAPDEPFHFDYVRALARHGALPDQTDPARRISSEGMGPPLYYAPLALALPVLDGDLGADLVLHEHADIERFVADPGRGMPARLRPPLNSRYVKWRRGDEPNMFLRMPEDRFPWSGAARTVHWLRVLSVLCGAGTVWLAWRLARHVWPERVELAALSTAFVAFDPQLAFVSGSINNDNGVILLSTAALLVATRLLVGDDEGAKRARGEWGLGVLIGLALLAKTNAAFLLPLACGAISWRARGPGFLRAALAGCGRVAVPVLVVAGWFFVRGARLYGWTDPLGFALRAAQNPDLVLPPSGRAAFFEEVFGARLFQSWWGLFDWITLPLPGPLYWLYGVLGGLAVAGLAVRLASDAGARERACLALCAGAFALSLAALVYLNFTFHSAQARLLFPSIAGVGVLLAGGLDTALGALLRDRPRTAVEFALPVSLALVSACVLIGVVAPAYP